MNIYRAREILGLGTYFTEEELKKAWKDQSKKIHPDVNKSPDAKREMQELNLAHELLQKVGSGISNFNDYKEYRIHEVEDIIYRLKKYDLTDKYNKKIVNLYIDFCVKENNIYKRYISDLHKCNTIQEINNVDNIYNIELSNLINEFVENIFSIWEINIINNEYINDLVSSYEYHKKEVKKNKTINYALMDFEKSIQLIGDKIYKIKEEIDKRIINKVEEIVLKYNSHQYYEILKEKIDKLKQKCIDLCIQKRTAINYSETRISSDIKIAKTIELLNDEIENLIKDYEMFKQEKEEKINFLLNKLEKYNDLEKSIINSSLKEDLEKLNSINDKEKFDNCYKEVKNKLESILHKISINHQEQKLKEEINRIKDQLLLKFNLVNNNNIHIAKNNSEILFRALQYISKVINSNNININKVLFLNSINFKDYEKDCKIIDFLEEKVTCMTLPVIVEPQISDERILELYNKIKPLVNVNNRKFLIREFVLNEIKQTAYLEKIKENITECINDNELEPIKDFSCYHTISSNGNFRPTIGQILSQIPYSLVKQSSVFEIVEAPKIVTDINETEKYHMSKVRLYKRIG